MTTGISEATSTGYCGGVSCAEIVARALALVADKWSVPVLEALAFAPGPARFRELQRRIGTITQKELSRQLTRFVHHGVVQRDSDPLHLSRVSYRLTERGRGLLAQLDRMGQWVRG
jgi:DNA-binding HxlR family transcriptional regulator